MRRTLLLCLLVSAGCACLREQPEMMLAVGLEPPEARFEVAPEIGEVFPDVTVVDDEGRPVNIRSLAGEKPYTVLTLGCLT